MPLLNEDHFCLVCACVFLLKASCAHVMTIFKLVTGSIFVNRWFLLCERTAKLLCLCNRGCGVCFVSGRERESVCEGCVCVRGVKPKPLSLADGHSEDGLTQEQWGPLTKTTPPRHVASLSPWQPPMGQGAG